jgi:serine/threonine-protein kinase
MPYVAGESLRQRLERQTQLSIEEAIEITRQVAAALDYAHRQGVVHRDIKPENILLQEGEAVVADFGIARALRVAGGERLTETGLSLGTPHYMSPEQASGNQELDGRSDVYSLACVMYEMLAGDPPFTGPTAPAIIARQLVDPVPSLSTVRPTVPEELERAIEKALAKVPADRYDTAGAFVEAAGASVQVEVVPTREQQVPRRRVSSRAWLVGAVVAAALIVTGVVLSGVLASRPINITVSNIRQITHDPGLEFQPAISPNGEEVAYVVGPIGNPRIVVRSTLDVGLGQSRPGEEVGGFHWLPAWTPDGASLRFLACPLRLRELSGCDWKEVGKLGGPIRSVSVPRVSSRSVWSRDGTRAAFSLWDSIWVHAADHGEPELLGVQVATDEAPRPHSLAWSPDGRLIAYVSGNAPWRIGANVSTASIWILDADGGEPVRVTEDEHMDLSPQWLPDSRHLLFVSDRDGARGIYVVEVGREGPRGPARSVLNSSDPHSISVSADGRRLAYAKFTSERNIWSIPIPRAGVVSISDAVRLTEGNQRIEGHNLSPDREWIVFQSDIRGESDIYKKPLEGGDPQLVADISGDAFEPDWSPDGTEIAFYGEGIWIVSADGGAPERVVDFLDANRPDWAPDGLSIVFQSLGPQPEGYTTLWIVARDSVGMPWGDPVQLIDFDCSNAKWAPDGASLVCLRRTGVWGLARVSRDGDVLSRYDPATAGLQRFGAPHFSPDGSRIYFGGTHEDGSEGVWWIPTNGGGATKVVAFDDPSLLVYGVGEVHPGRIYTTIAKYESDIWVMDLEW